MLFDVMLWLFITTGLWLNQTVIVSLKFSGAETQDVAVPTFADSVSEGDVRWEKNVGDQVAEDETVCEIETDKVSGLIRMPWKWKSSN